MDYVNTLSDNVYCHCQPYALNASCRVVKKNGPNYGRAFFCCQKPTGKGCGFFRFANENEVPMKTISGVIKDCPPKTRPRIEFDKNNEPILPSKREREVNLDPATGKLYWEDEQNNNGSPVKKAKIEVNNASLDPTSKSYREMACELLYQRLENQEEVMKKTQEVSLEIAKLLCEATGNLKNLCKMLTTIRQLRFMDDESEIEDEAEKEVAKILAKTKDK